MSDDEFYVTKKVPGRIYGSKSFAVKGPTEAKGGNDSGGVGAERRARYLDRVFPDVEGDVFAVVKKEVVLRPTRSGKRQVKLCVVENPRRIRSLILQNFSMGSAGEVPSRLAHFSLQGQEIDELLELAALAREGDFQTTGKFRIGVNQLQRLEITPDAVRALVGADTELLQSVLRSEVTEMDLVAVAYRKQQVKRFESLLRDPDQFRREQEQVAGRSEEGVWQRFFEENRWIFGGTLFMTSAGPIDAGKLERAVAGFSVAGAGKIVDGLLRTRGRVSALCFVEIKTPGTPLLRSSSYRDGVWAPSRELVGAVAQLQRTIQLAERAIGKSLRPTDHKGNPIAADAYLIRPRSVVICGDLDEFVTPQGVNEEKYSSFELFRRHLQSPDILTFDEVLERAKMLVETQE